MIASEVFLGVKPSAENISCGDRLARRLLFQGRAPRRSDLGVGNYTRAAVGGTGAVQCGGNYAASLRAQAEAIEHGCDQVRVSLMRSSAAISRNSAA